MFLLPLASTWQDFWNWFNHLDDPNRIAYWTFLASVLSAVTSTLIGYFAALAGAKRGAGEAARLARDQQIEDREQSRRSALIAVQYTLYSQANSLENLRVHLLEPFRNVPNRHAILPTYHLPDSAYRIAIESIYFIAETGEPSLLQDITISEQAYVSSMDALSKFIGQQERVFSGPNTKYEDFDMETGVGKLNANGHDVYVLKLAADALYRIVDESLPLLETAITRTGAYILERYNGMEALKITRKHIPREEPEV